MYVLRYSRRSREALSGFAGHRPFLGHLPALYRTFGERFRALDSWSAYVITSYGGIEEAFGRKADKNRKIYNGMMKTYFYEFRGQRPPKKETGQ